MAPRYEIIIIGGGIAGASVGYFLAERGAAGVLLLEREAQPGYHSSGRSAAALVEYHRETTMRALIRGGAAFLRSPPPGFSETPLVDPLGVIATGGGEAWHELQRFSETLQAEGIELEALSAGEILARVPVLAREGLDGGLCFPENGHLDVHALLWGYLRRFKQAGGELRCGVTVEGIIAQGGRCRGVKTSAGDLRARWVVNAAGAWAGELGRLAGAAPIAFTPLRRTIITFAAPKGHDVRRWPMIDDDHRSVYFKPESGGLLASPMDATAVEPGDARPQEEDVADVIEKLGTVAPALVPRTILRKWAGLRTMSPDRVAVVGEDPRVRGFFWLAGQGGVGIETSPALGAIAADLLLEGKTERFDAARLAPTRFAGR